VDGKPLGSAFEPDGYVRIGSRYEERTGVAAIVLGIVEQCRKLSSDDQAHHAEIRALAAALAQSPPHEGPIGPVL
jgi:hypothetical protein